MTLIQSVQRALHVLNLLAEQPETLTVREISRQLGLNISTAHHLVRTLAAENYIYQLPDGTYCLSHAIPNLYEAYRSNLRVDDGLLEILREVARRSRETAYISAWHNGDAVIESIVEGARAVRVAGMHVGFHGWAHARAGAKVLLAHLDAEALDSYVTANPLLPLTRDTLTDLDALKIQLQQVRQKGYAIDREEYSEGVCCIAAPIFAANGKVAYSLSVSVPRSRFDESEAEFLTLLTGAAAQASTLLGYRRTLPRAA